MTLLSPKSLSFLIIAVILTTIFSSLSITWADEEAYDEAEAIRRAAETLYNIDKQQKEAARRRWDEKHTSPSGDSGPEGAICCLAIVIVIVAAAVSSSKKKKEQNSPGYSGPRKICPYCGADNRATRKDCWSCNRKF